MKNSFDLISRFYDFLAAAVFGAQWAKIQISAAENLVSKRQILIVGGGSGKMLESLARGQQVTFLELSKGMIRKARRRKLEANVEFIHGDYLRCSFKENAFEAIVFPFVLDSFSAENLYKVLDKAHAEMKRGGELHVLDFQRSGFVQNLLVKLMYIFFRLVANVEAKRLLSFDHEIKSRGFMELKEQTYYGDWVFYRVYQRL